MRFLKRLIAFVLIYPLTGFLGLMWVIDPKRHPAFLTLTQNAIEVTGDWGTCEG